VTQCQVDDLVVLGSQGRLALVAILHWDPKMLIRHACRGLHSFTPQKRIATKLLLLLG
jgi:hypothetical protein